MASTWIATSVNGPYPANMVRGGTDSDGTAIYVGRGHYGGDVLPAKVIPEKSAAYVAFDNTEVLLSEVEVLVHKQLVWEPSSNGLVPPGAVEGGRTAGGETLYVCRAFHEGSHTIGKVHCSHGCAYIPYDGQEVCVHSYEVLLER